jgi:hypothetical protein
MKRTTLIRATVTLSLVGLLFIVPISQAKDVQPAQKNEQVLQAPRHAATLSSALHGLLAVLKQGSWNIFKNIPERGKTTQNPPMLDGGDNGCIKMENPGSQHHKNEIKRLMKSDKHGF